MAGVGTLNEKSLHIQLKDWYSQPGDQFEVPFGRLIVDIVRNGLLIEIQTRNLSAMRTKLPRLLDSHDVRVVFPIPAVKQLMKMGDGGEVISSRRSPKRGSFFDIFAELVSIPTLIDHPRFSLHVLLIEEIELRQHQAGGNWRRKGWRTMERRLDSVAGSVLIGGTPDLIAQLPDLPSTWTTADLAELASVPRRIAQQAAYTLKHAGVAAPVTKRGNALVYSLV